MHVWISKKKNYKYVIGQFPPQATWIISLSLHTFKIAYIREAKSHLEANSVAVLKSRDGFTMGP